MTYATRSIRVPLRRPASPVTRSGALASRISVRRVAGELAFIVGLLASIVLVMSLRLALVSTAITTPDLPVIEAALVSLVVAIAAFYASSQLKGHAAR